MYKRQPLYSGILEKLEFNSTTTKRKHEELFSVYYPNTNNRVVKKQAIANFSKPSPDDVVINQQKAAFEVDKIKEKVADLSIQDKQSSKTVEKEEDINDDDDDQEELLVPAGVPDTNVVIATVEEENRKEPPRCV